jgi:hypothetical protein
MTGPPLVLGSRDGWNGGKKYASANATTFFSGSRSTTSTKRMLSRTYNFGSVMLIIYFKHVLTIEYKG